MKQPQNARKQRARTMPRKGSSNNKGGGPGNSRSEMRVRGNPKQLLEKYKNQAREAMQAGDRVNAEYYFQFADHYQRVCNEMRGPNEPAWSSDDDNNGDYDDDDSDEQPQSNGNYQGNRGDQAGDYQQSSQPSQRDQDDDQDGQQQGRGRRGRSGRRNNGDNNRDSGNRDNGNRDNGNRDNGNRENGNREGATRDGGQRDHQPRRDRQPAAPDIAAQEQPVEVHPELDLAGTPAVEGAEKPKRTRTAAPRRRTARPRAEDGAAPTLPDIVPTPAPTPTDGEAA